MFSFTRFYLQVFVDLNDIIRRLKRNVILIIAIDGAFPEGFEMAFYRKNFHVRIILHEKIGVSVLRMVFFSVGCC